MGDLPSINEWDTFIVAAAGLVFVFISIGVARCQNYVTEKNVRKWRELERRKPRGASRREVS